MNDIHDTLIRNISDINEETLDLINTIDTISELPSPSFPKLRLVCENIVTELKKNTVRIGVVGTIKSGKSTLSNCILGGDYLKRGAGVLTSIVTRVRTGEYNKATLFLKNWENINEDIKQSIDLIPCIDKSLGSNFDIRKQKSRKNLEIILNSMERDHTIINNILNRNYTLLSSYLEGYQQIHKYIGIENKKIKFTGKDFLLHHNFVANDSLSVYLTDILLKIKGKTLGEGIEIADCQGSDSPNPLHLSMIQNYLNIAHLIIYVISSRTGMRKADIEFLSLIKRMGILTNTIFVINTDLNEHDSIEDIERIISNTRKNLFSIYGSPCQIFTFSALRNLILHNNHNRSVTDGEAIFQFVDQEYKSFLDVFNNRLNFDKYFLLANNHINKLVIISKNVENWVELNRSILTKNTDESKEFINNMAVSRSELVNIKTSVVGSVRGSAQQIKKKLFLNIDRFFGDKYQGIVFNALQFIQEWQFDFNSLDKSTIDNITEVLYKALQEFRQAIEKYIYEIINSNILGFIHEQEHKLVEHFESLSILYSSIFIAAAKKYSARTKNLNVDLRPSTIQINPTPIRNNIKLSPIVFGKIVYPKNVKIKATIHFYLRQILQRLFRAINVHITREQNLHVVTIKRVIEHVKRDINISIIHYLKNHRENIKFQYINNMLETVSKDIEQQISSQLNINTIKLSKISDLMSLKNQEKEKVLKDLNNIIKISAKISDKMKKITMTIDKISRTKN